MTGRLVAWRVAVFVAVVAGVGFWTGVRVLSWDLGPYLAMDTPEQARWALYWDLGRHALLTFLVAVGVLAVSRLALMWRFGAGPIVRGLRAGPVADRHVREDVDPFRVR